MKKAKIIGLSKFSYDVKDKATGNKTGERNTLGKIFCSYTDVDDKYLTGLCCAEILCNEKEFNNHKVGDEILIGKIGNRFDIAK